MLTVRPVDTIAIFSNSLTKPAQICGTHYSCQHAWSSEKWLFSDSGEKLTLTLYMYTASGVYHQQ